MAKQSAPSKLRRRPRDPAIQAKREAYNWNLHEAHLDLDHDLKLYGQYRADCAVTGHVIYEIAGRDKAQERGFTEATVPYIRDAHPGLTRYGRALSNGAFYRHVHRLVEVGKLIWEPGVYYHADGALRQGPPRFWVARDFIAIHWRYVETHPEAKPAPPIPPEELEQRLTRRRAKYAAGVETVVAGHAAQPDPAPSPEPAPAQPEPSRPSPAKPSRGTVPSIPATDEERQYLIVFGDACTPLRSAFHEFAARPWLTHAQWVAVYNAAGTGYENAGPVMAEITAARCR